MRGRVWLGLIAWRWTWGSYNDGSLLPAMELGLVLERIDQSAKVEALEGTLRVKELSPRLELGQAGYRLRGIFILAADPLLALAREADDVCQFEEAAFFEVSFGAWTGQVRGVIVWRHDDISFGAGQGHSTCARVGE